jgi:hypothetical protein
VPRKHDLRVVVAELHEHAAFAVDEDDAGAHAAGHGTEVRHIAPAELKLRDYVDRVPIVSGTAFHYAASADRHA